MSGSTLGQILRLTTFGESHGSGVGLVLDGVPPGIAISNEEIQLELNRRRPGQSEFTTPRKESDRIHILSGVFEGYSTGTALAMVLYNEDVRSVDYDDIKQSFRPGHADWSYQQKYGRRDWRGSGRASGRETAARVAGGAVAKKILQLINVEIVAYSLEVAGIRCKDYDPTVIEKNPLRACDLKAAKLMEERLRILTEEQDSAGGIIECRINGVPAGIGEPVFDKLEACLAAAMLSIGAVKGFEIGSGFAAARMQGSKNNDPMDGYGRFVSNNAGGVLGGISTGNEIIFRIPVKPTSSIARQQQTIDQQGRPVNIAIVGRHDPVICPRIVPVVEAMSALVIADLWLRQQRNLIT